MKFNWVANTKIIKDRCLGDNQPAHVPVPYNLCVALSTRRREKAILVAFSVITNLPMDLRSKLYLPVRAVFALGSFLCRSSAVFQGEAAGSMPPLFLSHGSEDTMVRPAWVTLTRDKLAGRASNEGSRRLR